MSILGIDNKWAKEEDTSPHQTLPKKVKRKSKKKILNKKESSLFVPKRDPYYDRKHPRNDSRNHFGLRKHQVVMPGNLKQMPFKAPPGMQEAMEQFKKGAGGIGQDFPQGDIGQPFWFSNVGGNHFPREGFTYRPYDTPIVSTNDQLKGYLDDEDARMGIDFLAAKTTGGNHYFKAKTKHLSSYVEQWTYDVNLNWLNWQIAKELLAFGNCFVRCRVPIHEATKPEDFHIIPIESAVRIWWTPDRRPLWYEFRGAEYNGYFRPGEILHFSWNQTNGQLFGFGIMAQLTNRVSYLEDTPDGPVLKERESYLDIKHGLQNISYKVMKRYLPRLIIDAHKAGEETRDAIREELRVLHDSEDIVHGIQGLQTEEINTQTRPIDPQVFMDLFQSSIFKATQTSKGRIAGQSEGPSYANGEESAILDEIGLAQFPIQLKYMIMNMIVKPWYEYNRVEDPLFWNGMLKVPWKFAEFDMMFGKQSKKDLEPEQIAQWIQILQNAGEISGQEIRKIAEYVGVPELLSDLEGGMAPDQPGLQVSGGGDQKGIGKPDATQKMQSSPTQTVPGAQDQQKQNATNQQQNVTNPQAGQGMGTGGQAMKVSGSPNKSKHSRV